MWVESVPQKGSTFHFTLPLQALPETPRSGLEVPQPRLADLRNDRRNGFCNVDSIEVLVFIPEKADLPDAERRGRRPEFAFANPRQRVRARMLRAVDGVAHVPSTLPEGRRDEEGVDPFVSIPGEYAAEPEALIVRMRGHDHQSQRLSQFALRSYMCAVMAT